MTAGDLAILSFYCLLGILHYFLIRKASSLGIELNATLIVLETEVLKLTITGLIHAYQTGRLLFLDMFQKNNLKIGLYYAVPSAIYSFYNLLTIYNLRYLDPSTYQVLMQSRVIFTAAIFQILLKRPIDRREWLALCLLTTALAVKHLNGATAYPLFFVATTLLQASLTSLASVYNEKLLKENREFLVQNGFMYSFGALFALGMFYSENGFDGVTNQSELQLGVVLLGATIGIITSVILKYIDCLAKVFASAIDVSLAAPIYALSLGEKSDLFDYLSCLVVSLAILLFYHKPSEGAAKGDASEEEETVEV
jgi:drug/metabolite transporter (DMT)-like permease